MWGIWGHGVDGPIPFMSVDRSITLEILVEKKRIADCLKLFFSSNWTPFDENNEIKYIPIGVVEVTDLAITNDVEVLYETIGKKEKRNELCLVHFWDEQREEAHALFIYPKERSERYNHFKLLISLGASKRLKGSQRQTDFSHYLEKIIPILESNNFLFESITCQDFG
jgi:hypothetical protein